MMTFLLMINERQFHLFGLTVLTVSTQLKSPVTKAKYLYVLTLHPYLALLIQPLSPSPSLPTPLVPPFTAPGRICHFNVPVTLVSLFNSRGSILDSTLNINVFYLPGALKSHQHRTTTVWLHNFPDKLQGKTNTAEHNDHNRFGVLSPVHLTSIHILCYIHTKRGTLWCKTWRPAIVFTCVFSPFFPNNAGDSRSLQRQV